MNGRVLVVGGDGLLGSSLTSAWRAHGAEVLATTRRRERISGSAPFLDLAESVERFSVPANCAIAVLCAAQGSLEQCRRDPQGTWCVNVANITALARRLADAGCFIALLSTSAVFDGAQPFRRAGEEVCPRTEYGRQKAAAETGVLQLGACAAVVRLTKVFPAALPLARSWRARLEANEPISPFDNYFCSPISLEHANQAIRRVVESGQPGIWQVSADTDMSYSDIALRLAARWGIAGTLVRPVPATSEAVEHLPRFTTLDTARLKAAFGLPPPSATETIDAL